MRTRKFFLMLCMFGLVAGLCRGHGVHAAPFEEGAGLRFQYDDGSPVAFAEVQVFAPGERQPPALTGLTDRNGCFMFRPDTQGAWHVTIDDGMGHVVSETLVYDGQYAAHEPAHSHVPKGTGALAGVSLLFGISGWAAYLRLKRAAR